MNEKDIDKLFSEAFKEAESSPPSDLWEKIEMQLPTEKKEVPILKRYRFAIASIAAAAVIVMGVALVLYTNKDIKTDLLATKAPAKVQLEVSSSTKLAPLEIIPRVRDTSTVAKKAKPTLALAGTKKKSPDISKSPVVKPTAYKNMELSMEQEPEKENAYAHLSNEIEKEQMITEIPVHQVTEIEPIKPLIEPEEDLESMYATQAPVVHKTVVTTLLNVISENIEVSTKKDIRFRADDEGSIRIDFINTIVKNRTKKRK